MYQAERSRSWCKLEKTKKREEKGKKNGEERKRRRKDRHPSGIEMIHDTFNSMWSGREKAREREGGREKGKMSSSFIVCVPGWGKKFRVRRRTEEKGKKWERRKNGSNEERERKERIQEQRCIGSSWCVWPGSSFSAVFAVVWMCWKRKKKVIDGDERFMSSRRQRIERRTEKWRSSRMSKSRSKSKRRRKLVKILLVRYRHFIKVSRSSSWWSQSFNRSFMFKIEKCFSNGERGHTFHRQSDG